MKMSRIAFAVVAVLVVAAAAIFLWTGRKDDSALRLRIESFAINLSPLKINETESGKVAALLYSPLVSIERDGRIQPRLAERWKRLPEGGYEFSLKRGVTFTDGRLVTSRDVVASLCRAMQPGSQWSWTVASIARKPAADGKSVECSGLEAVDAATVRIRESKPVPWLLHALDGPPGWVTPAEEPPEGAYNALPGSGPYRIERITPGEAVELAARSEGGDVPALVPRIVFRHVADPAQAAILFDTGELDLLEVNSPIMLKILAGNDLAGFAKKRGETLRSVPADRIRVLVVNEARLAERGFSASQISALKRRLRKSVDRAGIVREGGGLLSAELRTVFLPAADLVNDLPKGENAVPQLPEALLTILTEADPYSDFIAAKVATTDAGKTKFTYRGVQKSALIAALVEKKYDIVSVVMDSNVSSPAFWAAFFTPGNPFSLFGKPLPGMTEFDIENPETWRKAASLIDSEGNWVPVVRENRLLLSKENVRSVAFTPSGQVSLTQASKN